VIDGALSIGREGSFVPPDSRSPEDGPTLRHFVNISRHVFLLHAAYNRVFFHVNDVRQQLCDAAIFFCMRSIDVSRLTRPCGGLPTRT
jgi:hypothetical protein